MRFLIRFSGEVTTKSRPTRARFMQLLARNIQDALASENIDHEFAWEWSRFFVEASQPRVTEVLQRVYGIQSFSEIQSCPFADLDQLVADGERLFREHVRDRTFAVRVQRGEADVPFGSPDAERALGAVLYPHARGVDLSNPEVTINVEIRDGQAHFFTGRHPGPGGLPIGAEGRATSLVSGGFDSAVASWLMLKRGIELDYVFCNLGGAAHRQGVLRVMKVIADQWSYGVRPQLHVVDFRPLIQDMQAQTSSRYWQVLLKRFMYRAAERVSREKPKGRGIVTGEALGQVSSQTLPNLDVISRVAELPLLRPLVGLDKEEIIESAREIGTFELSAAVQEYCALVPGKPTTRAKLSTIEEIEAGLDTQAFEQALRQRAVYDLRELDASDLRNPDFELEEPPADARLIDVRSPHAQRAWQHPRAEHWDFFHAISDYPNWNRAATYVLVCEVGLKSADLAERMREAGFDAYSLRGGVKALYAQAFSDDEDVPIDELPDAAIALYE